MNYFEHKEPVFDHDDNTSAEREPAPVSVIQNQPKRTMNRRKKSTNSFVSYWFNLIFLFAIGFSLLGIDFILYNSTASDNVFSSYPVLRPEIMISLIIIAVLCGIIYFCLSGFTILLCILTGGIAYLSFYAFLNQFADFSTLTTLGYSSVYIAGAAALFIFALLFFSNTKFRVLLAFLVLAGFGVVLHKCNRNLPEFSIDNYQVPASQTQTRQRIINIMVPNLPSYALLSTLEDQNTNKFYRDQLTSIMMGFYARYNFKLYTNAFTKSGNPYLNAADSLNMNLPEDIYANLQNKLIKTNRWNFEQHNSFDVYLQNYKLLNLLKEQGYNINAYQNSGINLCQQNNQNVVNRCTTQNTFPAFKKYNNNLSSFEQSAILLINWLESTKWMDWLAKPIYQSINHIFAADNIPTIGNSYENISVINSLQNLNKLFEDISKDQGNNAYFITLDFLSDMYLFDDMCQLKDMHLWQVKNNYPWAKQNNTMEKRSAYFQQTMCLYGKLSQFMQNLQNIGALNNTVIIIQGLIGIDDLHKDENLLTSFLNTQMSPLAIYTPENKSFSINKGIYSSPNIMKQIFTGAKCVDFDGTNIAKSTRNNIIQHINSVTYNPDKIQNYYREYNEWLRSWNTKNFQSAASSSPAVTPEAEPEIIRPKAQLIPLEEKNITTQKVMQNTITAAPETKVESISAAAQKTPLIEE